MEEAKPSMGRGGGHGEKGPAHAVAEKAGHIVDGAGSNSHTQVAVCGHVDEKLTDGSLVKADVGEDLRLRMASGCGEHLCAALSGDLIGNKVADQVGVLKAQFST